ncbi:MAG TPA: hypothetical protein VE177_08405, partial [Candidatus Binatus sp.]|nr:hypothetical protein [Candidatus Binatus sp.]
MFDHSPGRTDTWDGYTYGYSDLGPFGGDAMYSLFSGKFSSANGIVNGSPVCAEATNTGNFYASNPTYVCNPKLDTLLNAQNQASTLDGYNAATFAAFNYYGRIAGDIPTYSPGMRTAALTAAADVVQASVGGYNNPWTLLNAHQSGRIGGNTLYAFGGGDPTTLRYGQASETTSLNPFTASTPWEFQLISEVYDTLLAGNPVNPTQIFCWMCNTFTTSVDNSGNEHFRIEMRQDLRWHDGAILDARDVAFSLLALRDVSAVGLGGGIVPSILLTVNVLSNTTVDIVFRGQSVTNPVFLESMILPRHLWQCDLVQEN